MKAIHNLSANKLKIIGLGIIPLKTVFESNSKPEARNGMQREITLIHEDILPFQKMIVVLGITSALGKKLI